MPHKCSKPKRGRKANEKAKEEAIVEVVRYGITYYLLMSQLTPKEKRNFYLDRLIAERQAMLEEKKAKKKAKKERKKKDTTSPPPFKGPLSLVDAYRDNDKCIELFAGIRWKEGRYCPCCGSFNTYVIPSRKHKYGCSTCKKQFTPLTGTIFASRQIPLYKMFLALLYEGMTIGGITPDSLATYIEVSPLTAYQILMDIRCVAMDQGMFSLCVPTVNGLYEYEADTTRRTGEKYNLQISQKSRFACQRQFLLVVKQRGGNVRVWPVEDETTASMVSILVDNLPPNLDLLCTDEAAALHILGSIYPGRHKKVVHCRGDYAHDDVVIEDQELIKELSIEQILRLELEMRKAGGEGLREVRVYTNSAEGWNAEFKAGLAKCRNNISKANTIYYANASVFRQNTKGKSAFEIFVLLLENIARMAQPQGVVRELTQPESATENMNKIITMAANIINIAA